jgi:pimeloyl-ACP methyl ester carboxylesterase
VKGDPRGSSSAPLSTPEGPGSVSGAPNLPAGFTDTFTSRYIDTGELRQHAVIGGDAPPLLLAHDWPETWYAWRLLMPALARDFEVIAVDQRGIGLTDKPQDGYDTGRLWHIPFNRVEKVPEQLVTGREDIFFGYEFAIQGGKLSGDVVDYYVRILSNPDALRGCFGFCRAFDTTVAQNEQRKSRRLTMPVLAIGGAASYGEHVAAAMQLVADDVHSVVIPGTGHWVADDAPEEMLAALTEFLAPYHDRAVAIR